MDNLKYVRETLIPGLLSDGKFDKDLPPSASGDADLKIGKIEAKPAGGLNEDHWASTTYFVTVALQRGDATKDVSIVIKFVCPDDGFAEFSLVDEMARNETRMYNSVMVLFDDIWLKKVGPDEPLGVFPRCYLAQMTPPLVVAMGNLQTEGFRLASERAFLDKHHLFQAIKKVAKFHALSFAAKAVDPENFRTRALELRETHYLPEKQQAQTGFLTESCKRGLRLIQDDQFSPEEAAIFERIKERLKDPFTIMQQAANVLRTPEAEPLAVVVHGDFLRNNIMFHYDKDGHADDVRLFDFQISRYTTPTYDLAQYLFMNATSELRRENWDDIFVAYHEVVSSTIRRLAGPNADVPSLESIRKDFAKNALCGYVICSFFLPMMVAPAEVSRLMVEIKGDEEKVAEVMRDLGGEEATRRLSDILRDCVKYELV